MLAEQNRETNALKIETFRQAGDGPIDQLLDLQDDASLTFFIRFSEPSALDYSVLVSDALSDIFPEPHDLSMISLTNQVVASIITPRSKETFDPVHIHSIESAFLQSIIARLPASTHDAGTDRVQIYPLAFVSSVKGLQENLAALNEMLETIINKRLRVQFQPIVDLEHGRVHGYESLIRLPQDGTLRRAGTVFQTADAARLVSWVDIAYQEKCFEAAVEAGLREYLFINMDADGLAHLQLSDTSLADRAIDCGIDPGRVVMEITERQAVVDFPKLVQYIADLRSQGFRVAIDDAGAGYNSLQAISEIHPDFLKIERSLIRGINVNSTHRALVESLTLFGSKIGTEVVAEGIETYDELAAVVDCGVRYGQGYLLGKPNDEFRGVRKSVREELTKRFELKSRSRVGGPVAIGSLMQKGFVLPPETPVEQVTRRFERNSDIECVAICTGDRIDGLVTPDLCREVSEQDYERPISQFMDKNPIVIESSVPIDEAANQIAYLLHMRPNGHVIVSEAGSYAGEVPIRDLVRALAEICSVARAKRQA